MVRKIRMNVMVAVPDSARRKLAAQDRLTLYWYPQTEQVLLAVVLVERHKLRQFR